MLEEAEVKESNRRRRISRFELYSFLWSATSILAASLLVPSLFPLFLVLALVDAMSTYAGIRLFLALDRVLFVLVLVLLTAIQLHFSALELILETLALMMWADLAFLMRDIGSSRRGYEVLWLRIQSYSLTIAPAALCSIGMLYFYSLVIPFTIVFPLLELGAAVAGVFLLVYYVMRSFLSLTERRPIKGTASKENSPRQ